jgi:transposase-like protein
MDEAYFGGPGDDPKRGRGTNKAKVLVGLSLDEAGHPEHAKMEVVDDVQGSTLLDFAERNIVPGSTIGSDAYAAYNSLAKKYKIDQKKFDPIENPEHLKWIHVVISNAKAFIEGTFHGLDKPHLQSYLDEFCYRFNRRKFVGQAFFRLLSCCTKNATSTYTELTL